MDKTLCRWCGEPLRKDKSGYRHTESDNGRCEVLRRRRTGDARTPIEPA
jgi:hypothetical protein